MKYYLHSFFVNGEDTVVVSDTYEGAEKALKKEFFEYRKAYDKHHLDGWESWPKFKEWHGVNEHVIKLNEPIILSNPKPFKL